MKELDQLHFGPKVTTQATGGALRFSMPPTHPGAASGTSSPAMGIGAGAASASVTPPLSNSRPSSGGRSAPPSPRRNDLSVPKVEPKARNVTGIQHPKAKRVEVRAGEGVVFFG